MRRQGLAEPQPCDSWVGAIVAAVMPSGTKSTCETDHSTTRGLPGLKQLRITGTSVTLWGTHTHCFAHMCWRVSWPCQARADICSIRSELGEEGGDLPTAQGCQRRDRRVCPRQQLGRTLTRPNLGEWVRSPPARWLPARMPRPPHPPDTPPAGQDREGQRPLVSLHLGFSEARGGQ